MLSQAALRPVRWRPVAGFVALLLATSFLYGLLTGTPPFGTVALWEGWTRCIEAGPLPCRNIGHPVGVDANVASTLIYGTFGLTRLGMSVATALNLLAITSLAAGLGALWSIGRRVGGSHLAGALAGAVYFAAPLVLQHAGLFQLFMGFAVLPVPLALVMAATSRSHLKPPASTRRLMLLGAMLLVVGLLLVYLDPYPWVVAIFIAAPPLVVAAVAAIRARSWPELLAFVALLGVLAVPGVVFRAAEADASLESESAADFYRGMGVDVGVATIPTTASTLGKLTSIGAEPWKGTDFTGDGSQVAASYLGIPLLLLAAIGALAMARRREMRHLLIGIALGGGACLLLSLGPSLKVVDRDPTPRGATITPGDYLMPPDDATLTFPWSPIFERQPFASMRATYRWQSGARVALTLLAAAGVVAVARRQRLLGSSFALLLLLDVAPDRLWDRRAEAEAHRVELDRFVDDMEESFGDERLRPGERVLFLPAENDYLVQYIAPAFDVRTYNISFDKAIAQIRPQQPAQIVEAITAAANFELSPAQLCELFRSDLVDAVVFDDFSLRWDSYRWPPGAEASASNRADLELSGLLETPGLEIDRGHLSVVVRSEPGGACAPVEGTAGG